MSDYDMNESWRDRRTDWEGDNLRDRVRRLEAELARYKAVVEAAQKIFVVAATPKGECPHGIIPSYPRRIWYCDDCWEELEQALLNCYDKPVEALLDSEQEVTK